ncbi:hypothetical protein MVEN_00921900 [Mycena venus]|uniref:Uncharacterized protein n=1 Tax=Mycena venus TaxID=2733690 RepID=A0A8H6YA07_9AGAR|nr:hypothetical protein MVEN_00921900 [Mycena venus]
MISILTTIYPSFLARWLKRKTPAGYVEGEHDAFLALRLAGELQILIILSEVYYECSTYVPSRLLDAPHITLDDKRKCLDAVAETVRAPINVQGSSWRFRGEKLACMPRLYWDRQKFLSPAKSRVLGSAAEAMERGNVGGAIIRIYAVKFGTIGSFKLPQCMYLLRVDLLSSIFISYRDRSPEAIQLVNGLLETTHRFLHLPL